MKNRLAGQASVLVMEEDPIEPRPRHGLPGAVACAWRGLCDAWRTQPNLRLHAVSGTLVIACGVFARLSGTEWLALILAIGLVVVAEMMNTVIERTVDLVVGLRPDPLARQVKDLAAGCVLTASFVALAIGAVVFGAHAIRMGG